MARADAWPPLPRVPVPIEPIITEVCRLAPLLAPGQMITCGSPPDLAVWGEADAIKQVLLILLDNALKHGDGPIAVTGKAQGERVAVSVHDAGPGIEPDLLAHLFEHFSRGKMVPVESGSEAGSGIGLGLAIAKALVEAQGGTIAVESQVGQGSVFTVTLVQVSALLIGADRRYLKADRGWGPLLRKNDAFICSFRIRKAKGVDSPPPLKFKRPANV